MECSYCFNSTNCIHAHQPEWPLDSLDYKKEKRRALAVKSREAAPKFGTREHQKLMDEIHEYMMNKAPPVPQEPSKDTPQSIEALVSPQNVSQEITKQHQDAPLNTNAEPDGLSVSSQVSPPAPSTEPVLQQQVQRVQKPADDHSHGLRWDSPLLSWCFC